MRGRVRRRYNASENLGRKEQAALKMGMFILRVVHPLSSVQYELRSVVIDGRVERVGCDVVLPAWTKAGV